MRFFNPFPFYIGFLNRKKERSEGEFTFTGDFKGFNEFSYSAILSTTKKAVKEIN